MIATEMASVDPIVMTTAVVLWKEAMVPTTYDKLRVITTCGHKIHCIKHFQYHLRQLFPPIVCLFDSLTTSENLLLCLQIATVLYRSCWKKKKLSVDIFFLPETLVGEYLVCVFNDHNTGRACPNLTDQQNLNSSQWICEHVNSTFIW